MLFLSSVAFLLKLLIFSSYKVIFPCFVNRITANYSVVIYNYYRSGCVTYLDMYKKVHTVFQTVSSLKQQPTQLKS